MSKRGRPPLHLPADTVSAKVYSRRQQINRWYAEKALAAVEGAPCAEYLGGDKPKISLLAELGRGGDVERIRRAAEVLAEYMNEQGVSVKAAEQMLRQARKELKAER